MKSTMFGEGKTAFNLPEGNTSPLAINLSREEPWDTLGITQDNVSKEIYFMPSFYTLRIL